LKIELLEGFLEFFDESVYVLFVEDDWGFYFQYVVLHAIATHQH